MGRPKGSENILSRKVKNYIGLLVEDNMESLKEEIGQMKGKQKVDVMLELIKYIVPKRASVDIDLQEETRFEQQGQWEYMRLSRHD